MKNIDTFDQESNIDLIKNLLKKVIKNWYLFIISYMLTISVGYFIYKSTKPLYKNSLVMLISQEGNKNFQNRSESVQFEMFDIQSSIEDELGILRSFPIINKTISQLDLFVSYYESAGLVKKEIYKNSPFTVISEPEISQPTDLDFGIKILSDNKFVLTAKSKDDVALYNLATNEVTGAMPKVDYSEVYNFGDNIPFFGSEFKIILNGNYDNNLIDKQFYFRFNNIEQLTYLYQAMVSIERQSSKSYLVNFEIKAPNAQLATDFLNTLAKVYLAQNLFKKNQIATKTINFIDNQISKVADSLYFTANMLKDFRTQHKVMDINFLSQNVYTQMTALQDQQAQIVVKSKYYDYIKEYFENNKDLSDIMAPSAMGVDDPQLVSLITQLTKYNQERSYYLDSKSAKNPKIKDLNAKINNIKRTILENIDYIVQTSTITLNDIDKRIAMLNTQISKLPTTEKELINIKRKFNINDGIYTFLLEKRSEAQIAKASNSPDYEVVDPAKKSSVSQVAPKKKLIFFGVFLLGLMLPIGLIMLVSAINETVTEKRDVEKLTNFPLLTTIAHNENKSMVPVADVPKSSISESFRSLRTSLQFFHKEKEKENHRFLVTSSSSGDGKTFLSINLAVAYSYFGKKTLLVEFDLRNPKISKYLGLDETKGLSSYLVNDVPLEDIIQHSRIKNLDIITSGELPPNPVELMASENTKNLMEILQSVYDYIIIDSPPIGVVTDSFLLMNYSDINIFAVRLNHTNKQLFASLVKDIQQKQIQNFAIVINDDEEQVYSSYYERDYSQLSYFRRKLNTLSKLLGNSRHFNKKDTSS